MRRLVLILMLVAGLSLTALPTASAAPGVADSQRRLNTLGCDSGPADGVLGDHTRAAVIRFQSRNGLAQTGTLNDVTKSRLRTSTKRCDRRPVPAGSGTGRRIVISQKQNWVWLVRADGSVVAQSGMIDNPSQLSGMTGKVGSYCGRSARIQRNYSEGGLILANFVRWQACGVGFHRIPQYTSGAQIHPDWMVGTNLRESHGCIRLPQSFSLKLWSFAAVGTKVRVV